MKWNGIKDIAESPAGGNAQKKIRSFLNGFYTNEFNFAKV
jgi:hypothetical protein